MSVCLRNRPSVSYSQRSSRLNKIPLIYLENALLYFKVRMRDIIKGRFRIEMNEYKEPVGVSRNSISTPELGVPWSTCENQTPGYKKGMCWSRRCTIVIEKNLYNCFDFLHL